MRTQVQGHQSQGFPELTTEIGISCRGTGNSPPEAASDLEAELESVEVRHDLSPCVPVIDALPPRRKQRDKRFAVGGLVAPLFSQAVITETQGDRS